MENQKKIELTNITEIKLTDYLAIDRTNLANERTFLSYFRTFIVFISSGFTIIKIEFLKEISLLGYFLIIIAPTLLLIGIVRYFLTKSRIKKYTKHLK